MPIGILQYVADNLPNIMTGLTMAVIGIAVYEARDGFFLFRGQFRGKIGALMIFLATLIGASLFTPQITQLWAQNLPYIPPGQLLGMILVLGMIGVNKAAEWNYVDAKSALVYLVGLVLIVNPDIIAPAL